MDLTGPERATETMMLIDELTAIHASGPRVPVVVRDGVATDLAEMLATEVADLSEVRAGDVVALVGDYAPSTVNTLLRLVDRHAIIAPLCTDMEGQFDYLAEAGGFDWVVRGNRIQRLRQSRLDHPLLRQLRDAGRAGLILFSSGTTGRPKAVLHDLDAFIARYRRNPKPGARTLSFLVFDHIGGLNALFATLFNRGTVFVPSGRKPDEVMAEVARHRIETLPATPTFLRMLMMSGLPQSHPEAFRTLRTITYSTEPMDKATLDRVCTAFSDADIRQTYGMSELGIMRVRSRARDSLWISVGGDGVETRVQPSGETGRGVLQIRCAERMLGYLNAPSPFEDGWYDTGDVVEQDGEWLLIVGRSRQWINVGGIKVLPTEIERVALLHPAVVRAKAEGAANPITGQHVEVTMELRADAIADKAAMRAHFAAHLADKVRPHRYRFGAVSFNHRFKQA